MNFQEIKNSKRLSIITESLDEVFNYNSVEVNTDNSQQKTITTNNKRRSSSDNNNSPDHIRTSNWTDSDGEMKRGSFIGQNSQLMS